MLSAISGVFYPNLAHSQHCAGTEYAGSDVAVATVDYLAIGESPKHNLALNLSYKHPDICR